MRYGSAKVVKMVYVANPAPARAPCPLTRVKGSGVGQREGRQRHRDIKMCVSFMDKQKMGKVLRV